MRREAVIWIVVAVVAVVVLVDVSALWATPFTAVGTVLAAVAAITFGVGGYQVRGLFFRPVLDLKLAMSPPDSHRIETEVRDPAANALIGYIPTYYYRLRIDNTGNAPARDVEVRLLRLRRQEFNGSFTDDPNFLPLNLTWSHIGGVALPTIHPNIFHHCDLLHVVQNTPLAQQVYPDPRLFMLNTQVRPTKVGPGVWPTLKPRGTYELDLVVYASNARPLYKTLTVVFRRFYASEIQMFLLGLTVTVPA